MPTENITYKLLDKLANKTVFSAEQPDITIVNASVKHSLESDTRKIGLSIATEAGKFQMSLDSGVLLAKSMKTGEVKAFDIEPGVILKNTSVNNFEVRDSRVQPKHNFTKADPGVVNIFAHKGPDEPSNTVGWSR